MPCMHTHALPWILGGARFKRGAAQRDTDGRKLVNRAIWVVCAVRIQSMPWGSIDFEQTDLISLDLKPHTLAIPPSAHFGVY